MNSPFHSASASMLRPMDSSSGSTGSEAQALVQPFALPTARNRR